MGNSNADNAICSAITKPKSQTFPHDLIIKYIPNKLFLSVFIEFPKQCKANQVEEQHFGLQMRTIQIVFHNNYVLYAAEPNSLVIYPVTTLI